MTSETLAETVSEKLRATDQVLSGLQTGGGEAHLQDLGLLLIGAMGLFDRNPGLEAAADDLYAAAVALVRDSHVGAQPIVRKQRLLREARLRLGTRITSAV